MGVTRSDRVWIAWERQRRSITLAGRVQATLRLFLYDDRSLLRYPLSIAGTVAELWRRRGQTVFVQNPSQVLAALAVLLRRPLGYFLVVDRHSNFEYLAPSRSRWRGWVAERLSRFTLRGADMTIVTNDELARYTEAQGARSFVLPDPFPVITAATAPLESPVRSPIEVLFVASWAPDEPIVEMMEACRRLQEEVVVRITGRPKAAFRKALEAAPPNFISTGFLSDAEYFETMARSDAVVAISKRAATLVCGGYEAAALGKPMVLGDSRALREFFDRGALYTSASADDLERTLRDLVRNVAQLRTEVREFFKRRSVEWDERLRDLERRLPSTTS